VAVTRAAAPARHAVLHELRVAAVERLTEDSVAITLAVPVALRPEYRHVQGQHVSVRCPAAGDELRRSYSISTPAGSDELRIAVKLLPGGVFSAYAHTRLRPGEALEVMTPVGGFHVPLDPAARRHHAAIAAGSGIVPILSIAATTLEVEPLSRVTLACGNRTTQSVMFLEELSDLKDRFPDRLAIHHVLSREPRDSELLSGRLDPARLRRLFDSLLPPRDVDEWFVCGPAGMIEGARAVLTESGIDAARVHVERFHAEGVRRPASAALGQAAPGSPAAETDHERAAVTVLLDGRASTFTMARQGEVILDAALRARPESPYSCRDGVCGTCRARLTDGRVRMDHCDALEPAEVAAGYVLACQSHPETARVTLDFDG
jgi:ring-1,2-phenylacetyl-CoA epoxidase subunit PaaE